jgi:hypothetical protein
LYFFAIQWDFLKQTEIFPYYLKTKFNRFWGAAYVWGVQISGTNYALVTLACPPLEEWRIEHCEYK